MDNQEDVLQKFLNSDDYLRIFYNEKEEIKGEKE